MGKDQWVHGLSYSVVGLPTHQKFGLQPAIIILLGLFLLYLLWSPCQVSCTWNHAGGGTPKCQGRGIVDGLSHTPP